MINFRIPFFNLSKTQNGTLGTRIQKPSHSSESTDSDSKEFSNIIISEYLS